MELYQFHKLSLKLDDLNYPRVTESRFEIVRKDLTEEELRGNIKFKEDGIYLLINGIEHKGYMYMKSFDIAQYGLPKFHITKCQTITTQQNNNRFNGHYFWHNSNVVDVTDRHTHVLHQNEKINLCGYCREMANITNYINTQGFFDLLDIQGQKTDITADLDMFGYVKEWQQISKKFRIENNFTCDLCKIIIENKADQRYIQVHHKNGNKINNTRENLQCLCTLCHANVDSTHIANFQKNRSIHEINSFVEKYKTKLIGCGNRYINSFL